MDWSVKQGLKFTFKHVAVLGVMAMAAPVLFHGFHDWIGKLGLGARDLLEGAAGAVLPDGAVSAFTENVGNHWKQALGFGGPEPSVA